MKHVTIKNSFRTFLSGITVTASSVILLLNFLPYPSSSIGSNFKDTDAIINVAPLSVQTDYWITKYSKEQQVPEYMVRRCAYYETRFEGASMFSYNPTTDNMVSSANARGPLQVTIIAAREVWGDSLKGISNETIAESLRYNIQFNVHTGVRLMRKLYNTYKYWPTVFSIYNQGNAGVNNINKYAKNITR